MTDKQWQKIERKAIENELKRNGEIVKKPMKKRYIVLIIIGVLWFLGTIMNALETPKEKEKQEFENKVSNLVFQTENSIKKRLHDPDSYKKVNHEVRSNGVDTFFVIIDYRAKNGFGAMRL